MHDYESLNDEPIHLKFAVAGAHRYNVYFLLNSNNCLLIIGY